MSMIAKILDAADEIAALYECPGCECGGPCHIVVDDDNVSIDSIGWCLIHLSDVKEDYGGNWARAEAASVCVLLCLLEIDNEDDRKIAIALAANEDDRVSIANVMRRAGV